MFQRCAETTLETYKGDILPFLKLTACPLKIDGGKAIVPFRDEGIFEIWKKIHGNPSYSFHQNYFLEKIMASWNFLPIY